MTPRRMGLRCALALLALTATAGCQPALAPSASPAAAIQVTSGPQASVADGAVGPIAVDAVESFDGSPEAIVRLNGVLDLEGDPIPALIPFLDDADTNRRFGAIYLIAILSDSPADFELLRRALDDSEPAYRAMAAGALVGGGVADAIPVLIDILESAGQLPYSEPPTALADYARDTLESTTGQSHPDADRWRAWWAQAGSSLRWDGARYVAN